MLFVGTVEGLCTLSVQFRDCAVCLYSRGTLLFVGTVD